MRETEIGWSRQEVEDSDPFVLWFDGEWEWPWTHEMGTDLYAYVRGLSPGILINNRVDKGRRGMGRFTASESYAGDFDTPEQEIRRYDVTVPWESCITIGEQWAWRPNDRIFLHLTGHPGSPWTLPMPEPYAVRRARFLSSGKPISFESGDGSLVLRLPEELPDAGISIVELEMNRDVTEMETIERYRY